MFRPGKNYEETILALKNYTVAEKIPIKWILYDSWFYKKCNFTNDDKKSPAHGAINWTDADPSIFPSGLRAIYRATGWYVPPLSLPPPPPPPCLPFPPPPPPPKRRHP